MNENRTNPLTIAARVFACIAAACVTTLSVACNTTSGVGQDIEAAGDAIEDAAEDAQD